MVEYLLKGFVNEEWVEQLDFSTLEKVNGSYVSDDLRDSEDDIVWRIRWGKTWLYVYILLEFQSGVDLWREHSQKVGNNSSLLIVTNYLVQRIS